MTKMVTVSPEEIIEQVLAAISLGVNMVHLHARESGTGYLTYKKEIYAEINHGIRKENKNIVLAVSTRGRNFSNLKKVQKLMN